MIQIYLDGNLIQDTPEFGELKEVIELDKDLKSWAQHFDETQLTFYGDGFNYIKGKKDEFGYNYRIDVQIVVTEDSGSVGYGDVIKGYIYLVDAEIEHTKRYVEVSLVELYNEGTIKQNHKLKFNLFNGGTNSINGVDISTSVAPRAFLKVFDPADGTYYGTTHYGVEIVDALKWMVAYISDNGVGFRDEYFAANWGDHKFALTKGYELRKGDHTVIVQESLFNTMANLYKIFNIWWYIDYSTLKPTFVIAHRSEIDNNPETLTIPYVKNIKESFYEENFFNAVEIGTETYILPPTADDYWLQFVNGFTHHYEKFNGRNNTLIDQTLDLVSDWVMDHNVISQVVKNGSTEYDDRVFFIEYDNNGFLTDEATQYTYGNLESDTRRLYNENLLNYNRLRRFDLPLDLGFDSGDGSVDDNFEATGSLIFSPALPYVASPFEFDTEVSDPNNNYNPTTFRYVMPSGVPGNYGFYAGFKIAISNLDPLGTANANIEIFLRHYYPSGTLKQVAQKTYNINKNSGPEGITIFVDRNFILAEGDYVDVLFETVGSTGTYDLEIRGPECVFKTLYVQNQGGLVTGDANIRAYYGSLLKFGRHINLQDWKTLKNNLIQNIIVSKADGRIAETKIKKIERVIKTGKATFELITKQARIGL